MTVLSFEGNGRVSELKETEDCGYPVYYHDIYVEDDVLPPGALIYVKDRYDDEWHPAEFDGYRDELWARIIGDRSSGSWRYALIPKKIQMPKKEGENK